MWIELSFKEAPASVTKAAKPLGLKTEIVYKVPRWGLTVMKISGEAESIREFLTPRFEERFVQMHMRALKN